MNPVRVELKTGRARPLGGPTLELNATLERMVHEALTDLLRLNGNRNSIEELRRIDPYGHWRVRAKRGKNLRVFEFDFDLANPGPIEGMESLWVSTTAGHLWSYLNARGFLIP